MMPYDAAFSAVTPGVRSHRLEETRSIGWLGLGLCFFSSFCMPGPARAGSLDDALRGQLTSLGITPLGPPPAAPEAKTALGRALFFDKELSGNRDIACATCHHPSTTSGDARSLPLGTGGTGLGPDRQIGAHRRLIPRNSPEVFNRGDAEWTTMFWDSRVASDGDTLITPAGGKLPSGLDNVLSAQAMFPVTSRDEMRGAVGDTDVHGGRNELADIEDGDEPAMWRALMQRLMAIAQYQQMFQQAYPGVAANELGFQHAANAIGAFEAQAFSRTNSAWDRYVAGDDRALTESAKRGALIFHGAGNCSVCHAGNHFTDQQHHNIGAPQLGPGKDPDTGLDPGRAVVTGDDQDGFAFRTPPLRNVVATGPWLHSGTYTDLEDVIRHHLDPAGALASYDPSQLDDLTRPTLKNDPQTRALLTASLDPALPAPDSLSDQDVDDLAAFLFSLTSPTIDMLPDLVPDEVPSGLPVDRLDASSFHLAYTPTTGALAVVGPDDPPIIALMLRIKESGELPEGLAFQIGAAPWSGISEIVLANEAMAQSFWEYRSDMSYQLHDGDRLEALLPAGLDGETLARFLTATYVVDGSPVLWRATIAVVPEPTGIVTAALALAGMCLITRRRRL